MCIFNHAANFAAPQQQSDPNAAAWAQYYAQQQQYQGYQQQYQQPQPGGAPAQPQANPASSAPAINPQTGEFSCMDAYPLTQLCGFRPARLQRTMGGILPQSGHARTGQHHRATGEAERRRRTRRSARGPGGASAAARKFIMMARTGFRE
jgi:hypothetical protein